jgi:hypothetical protein
LVVKVLIYIKIVFIFSTPELIRHLWQLKTIVFLHWCLICAVLLDFNEADTLKSNSILIYLISVPSIDTQMNGIKAKIIKKVRLNYAENCSILTAFNQANLINGK